MSSGTIYEAFKAVPADAVHLKATLTGAAEIPGPGDPDGQGVANPAGYYVNVHTSDFPAGAACGQLKP